MTPGTHVRDWLVGAAQRIDAALGPARVKRIVLPPLVERPGKEGEFCAVQLDDGSVGMAFTLLGGTLGELHARGMGGGQDGAAAMALVASGELLLTSITPPDASDAIRFGGQTPPSRPIAMRGTREVTRVSTS